MANGLTQRSEACTGLTAWLWATPNSRRVSILFEELGLDYRVIPVDIRAGEQFAPEILAMNPFGKIPIVTWTPEAHRRVLFETAAILVHFGGQDARLLPADGPQRDATLSWLMLATSGLAPASGQAHHWLKRSPEKSQIALEHAQQQVSRVWSALDARLRAHPYLAGDDYSIADIAAWPWIERHTWTGLALDELPNLTAWFMRVSQRPAVQRGMEVPSGVQMD
ncbi:MAG: glutathione S-transferase family protein [Wenzhouxiangellaceae bacterium]|nr:glutathione S-transferase family protein [Wenzhouxiangellaceae bacterium]